MIMRPYKVTPERASAISSSDASIAGPVAAIAEAPHTAVPTPISADSVFVSLKRFPSQSPKKKKKKTTNKGATNDIPKRTHTIAETVIPSAAMLPCWGRHLFRIVDFVEK
jgi:hypothetical protein